MRHGKHIRRVAENGGGQFRRFDGSIQNSAGLRIVRSVRPNSYDWRFQRDARLSDRQRPWPYDFIGFVDLMGLAGGIMTEPEFLFGKSPSPLDSSQGQNADELIKPTTNATPIGQRGTIDQLSPMAIDVFGNVAPTVFPSGTTVVWSLLVNGRPAAGYNNITTQLDSWGKIAERPIVELGAGDTWAVTVYCSANAIGLAAVGARVRVRFENMAWLNGDRDLHQTADLDFLPERRIAQAPNIADLPPLHVPYGDLLARRVRRP